MILRIWRAQIEPSTRPICEQFEQTYSLPMFRALPGCLGVFFLFTTQEWLAASLWDSQDSIEKLSVSSVYQETVNKLVATGLLVGEQSVELLEVTGGFLETQWLERFAS